MQNKDLKLDNLLKSLELSEEEIRIYSNLFTKGEMTALNISRQTKIERTKVYRILENMLKRNLISEIVDEKRRLFTIQNVQNLELLVKEKEIEAKSARENFDIISQLLKAPQNNHPETKVIYYKGKEGIKRLIWNTLRAKDEILGYTLLPLLETVNRSFLEEWVKEFVFRGIKLRDLYSDTYRNSDEKTQSKLKYPKESFASKYISPEVLDITHQMDIYNDVVSFYTWHKGEIMGVEIINPGIAKMQKQLFEVLWKSVDKIATKFDKLLFI